MSIGTNELFKMLSWNSDVETQQKGIEEGMKVQYISIFIQPIEDKSVWENCAKIIEQKTDEILEPYMFLLLDWLQDENWPGFDIIFNRIQSMPVKMISNAYSYTIKKAVRQNDVMWLTYLAKLAENKELYRIISQEERNIIDEYCN